MTDIQKLKALAEASLAFPGTKYVPRNLAFDDAANPAAVLELIANFEANRHEREVVCANYDQLKAENDALRKDAERYRWLRDQEALQGGIAILPVGLWVKPAMLCTSPFDSGEMTDSVVDAAMTKEEAR